MTTENDDQQATFRQLYDQLLDAARENDPLAVTQINEKMTQLGEKNWEQPPGLFDSPYVEQDLENFRSRYDRGDKIALFHAIQYCANTFNFLPPWIRAALNKGMTRYDCYYDKRLDESFDIEPRKDAKLSQRNDFARRGLRVHLYVISERAKGVPLTDTEGGVYYEAGRLFSKSPSTIRKWTRQMQNIIDELP